MAYESAYTGPEIDTAVGRVLSGQAVGPQGPQGEQGPPGPAGEGGAAGVSSFNGRTGEVVPGSDDYTAEMVGAATMEQVNAAIQAAVLDSWG